MMTIGERIQRFRLFEGMTQRSLGEASGIAEVTIRKYELGLRIPKLSQIQKLAKGLNISAWALIGLQNTTVNYENANDLIGLFISLLDIDIIQVAKIGATIDESGSIAYESMTFKTNPLLSEFIESQDNTTFKISDPELLKGLSRFRYIKETYYDRHLPFDKKEIISPGEQQFYGCEKIEQNKIIIR